MDRINNLGAARESVVRIVHPAASDYSAPAIAAICAALAIKIALGVKPI